MYAAFLFEPESRCGRQSWQALLACLGNAVRALVSSSFDAAVLNCAGCSCRAVDVAVRVLVDVFVYRRKCWTNNAKCRARPCCTQRDLESVTLLVSACTTAVLRVSVHLQLVSSELTVFARVQIQMKARHAFR